MPIVLGLSVFLGATSAVASPQSLKEVIALTVQNSPVLQTAQLSEQTAQASTLAQSGVDDWVLQLTGSWSATPRREFGLDLQNSFSLDAGLSKPLSTGGTVFISGTSSYTDEIPGFTEPYRNTLLIGVRHPLLAGAGKSAARADLLSARAAENTQTMARQWRTEQTIKEVVHAYWELVYAHESLRITQKAEALAKEQLRLVQERIRAGSLAPSEEAAALQKTAESKEQTILSERNVLLQTIALRGAMGVPWSTASLVPNQSPSQISIPAVETAMQKASRSSEVLYLELLAKEYVVQLKAANRNEQSNLDLSVSIGPSGTGDTFSESAENLASFDDYVASVELALTHSFGNRSRKGTAAIARLNVQSAEVRIREAKLRITSEIVSAHGLLRIAVNQEAIADEIIRLAQKNVETEQTRFQLGRSTSFDVSLRQDELTRARLKKARAMVDGQKALVTLRQLTGGLLSDYGIILNANQ